MKKIGQWICILLFFGACGKTEHAPENKEPSEEIIELSLYNKKATKETKALYSKLWSIQDKGFMFGHHDGLLYGREWIDVPGRSDVYEIVGDYPAVYSVDFAELIDDRKDSDNLNEARKRTILEARERGEVITAVCHLNNPLTGGDAWDNSSDDVVKEILKEGSPTSNMFLSWLDNLAELALSLRDSQGNLIPIIYRPFHEHTQEWPWWGSKCTTSDEFIQLWRYTLNYLSEKGVENFIYAISPQRDDRGSQQDLLFRWPGDDFVDFIGMDCYHGMNTSAFKSNLKAIQELSQNTRKPCGVTETGIEGIRNGANDYVDYWTKEILTPLIGKKVCMVVMWRNKYDPLQEGYHFYGPWKEHGSSDDFKTFHRSKVSFFSEDLPDMYVMKEGTIVN